MADKRTINAEELSVISQFVRDGLIGSINRGLDIKQDSVNIKLLTDHVRKTPEPGDVCISSEMTYNGGHITIHQIVKLESKSDTGEKRNYIFARSMDHILIEPVGYPDIEPFNRQSPYYIGLGYDCLTKHSTELFEVYTGALRTESGSTNRQIHTSFDEFCFNDFWKKVKVGLAIRKEDAVDFLQEFISILGFDKDVSDIVGEFSESVLKTHLSKEQILNLLPSYA